MLPVVRLQWSPAPRPGRGYAVQRDNGQLPSPTFATMEHDDARDRMRKALDQVHKWPVVYMFKFIFEPEEERLNAVLALVPARGGDTPASTARPSTSALPPVR